MQKLADQSVFKKSDCLKNRKICLCVTGSIAAVETVKLVREARRHGADVHVFMTDEAQKFITPLSLEWASQNPVILNNSYEALHLKNFDLYLVAPSTINTLNKFCSGHCDNIILTTLASAWGREDKIVFVPCGYEDLYNNPVFKNNLKNLQSQKNIFILDPLLEENKLKLQNVEHIVATCSHLLNKKDKKILINAGPTRAYIDSVRYIENISTGKLGLTLADAFYRNGLDVKLIYGPGEEAVYPWLNAVKVETASHMFNSMESELKNNSYDATIFSAAVLDFEPEKKVEGKISSFSSFSLELKPTEKIITRLKTKFKIGFKLVYDMEEIELLKFASDWKKKNNIQVLVVNDLKKIDQENHPAWILEEDNLYKAHTKNEIAERLLAIILEYKAPHADVDQNSDTDKRR